MYLYSIHKIKLLRNFKKIYLKCIKHIKIKTTPILQICIYIHILYKYDMIKYITFICMIKKKTKYIFTFTISNKIHFSFFHV